MRRSFVIVFLALLFFALRVEHSVLFYDLGRDKRYQMIAAGNFAAGNGITHCITTPDDISAVICPELTWWSAGYPLLVGSLYKITGDLIAADYILVLVGILTFLLASFRFFSLWSDGDSGRLSFGLFLIFAGFSFTPFNYFQTNDLLSTAYLILAIAEASHAFKDRRRLGFIAAGLAIFAAGFFKFSFYPFIAVIPVGLILFAVLRRNIAPLIYLLYFLIPLAACFLALLIAFPNHILPPGGVWLYGWNWDNLTFQDPFGSKALFFIDFLLRRLDPASVVGLLSLLLIHAFSIFVLAASVYIGGRYVLENHRARSSEARNLSIVLGIVTVAITVAYLSWLSIRLPTFYHPVYEAWTFVQETRYYGPAMVLLIYAVFIIPPQIARRHPRLRLASLALVLAVCSYATAYWAWKNYDYFYNGRIAGSFAGGHRDDAAVAEFLKNDFSLDRDRTVLGFMSHAGAYGYPILLIETDPARYPFPWHDWYVGSTAVRTSQPRTLLVIIPKSPSDADTEILARHRGARLLELTTYDLYRLEVSP